MATWENDRSPTTRCCGTPVHSAASAISNSPSAQPTLLYAVSLKSLCEFM